MIKLTNRTRHALVGYAFVSAWIVGYAIFTLWPMIYSCFLSFNKVRITPLGIKTRFVHFDNYKYAFTSDPKFIEQLVIYLKTIVFNVPIIIVFSLIIALLLNQKIVGKGIFRTIFFLPVIITSGPVINELMSQKVSAISIKQYGIFSMINQNMAPIIADPISYLFQQIIMMLWFSGVPILIFLAGLQKIDKEMYEAANIDGASAWEAFWKITLPSLRSLILVNVIYTIVSLSTFSLNGIIKLIKGDMFDTYTGFGYATALAWIYFVIISIMLILSAVLLNLRKR